MSWTELRVEQMTTLWSDGHSAGSIAREMGGFDECLDGGRCAVIGKLYRLGLVGSGEKPRYTLPRGKGYRMANAKEVNSDASRARRLHRVKTLRQRPARIVIAEPLAVPQSLEKSLVELEHGECKWPSGDGPYTFCGHPVRKAPISEFLLQDSAYCPWHCSIAFNKGSQRDVDRIASRAMGSIRGHDKSTVMEV